MSSTSDSQEPVQERLKDQVSLSIKGALDKANTVLTNLHRVQSYLDVIRILSTRRSGDVIKNALEQIHSARNDTATLLQHIYLTEIGLQSLQDFDNGGTLVGQSGVNSVVSATNISSSPSPGAGGLGSLVPVPGAGSVNGSAAAVASAVAAMGGVDGGMMVEGLGSEELDFTTSSVGVGTGSGETDAEEEEDDDDERQPPPTKKMKPGGVMVSTCISCNRKFAAPYSASSTNLCRLCRSSPAATNAASAATSSTNSPSASKFPFTGNSAQKSFSTSTPKTTRSGSVGDGGGKQGSRSGSVAVGGGRNTVPMMCKICNTCFRYRKCLFRHIRENHPGVDQDNLTQYIDVVPTNIEEQQNSATGPSVKGITSPSGGKLLTGDREATTLANGNGGVDQDNLMQYIDLVPTLNMDRQQNNATSPSAKGNISLSGGKKRRRQLDGSVSMSSSLHVTIGSEVSDLNVTGASSMLTGDRAATTPGDGNGVLLGGGEQLEIPHSHPSSDVDDDDDNQETVDNEPQPLAPSAEAVADNSTSSTLGKVPGKFDCSICHKSFDRPYRLQRHIQIHNPNRPRVQCQFCDRSFTRIDTLENHFKSMHSNERPFKCTFEGCDKSFPHNSALVHHLKTHMGGKPYQCGECDLSFALFGEFKVHVNETHVFTKDRRCPDCFKLFSTAEELSQHCALEHRYECEICGKSFARLGYLQTHIEIHNGVSMFNCRQCDAGFDSEYSYKQHIKAHPNYNKAKRVYPCQICGKTFYDSRKMIAHSHSDEHQEKAKSLGLPGGVILHNISQCEDDPTDMSVFVDEVANSIQASGTTGTPSVDDNLIQSIVESEAFKAAAASVGVSTAAATVATTINTSINSRSAAAASSLLNSGGVAVSQTAGTLLHCLPSAITVTAVTSAEQ